MATNRKYWKGLEELNETPEFLQQRDQEFMTNTNVEEFLGYEQLKETSTARRDFLKFLGFSVAAATVAACEAPVVKAVPYVNKPEDVIPGQATWYASTYYDIIYGERGHYPRILRATHGYWLSIKLVPGERMIEYKANYNFRPNTPLGCFGQLCQIS